MNAFNAGAGALIAALFVSGIFSGVAGGALVAVWGADATDATGAVVLIVFVVSGVAIFRMLRRRTLRRPSEGAE